MAGLNDAEQQDREPDLSRLEFRFAKSMPETPHWYVVRSPANEADYVALFHAIREKGVDERFGKRRYRYWRPSDGFKYWAMTTNLRQSHVINRAKVGDRPPGCDPRADTDDPDDDGPDLSGYDPHFSISTPAERREAAMAEVAEMAAYKRHVQRREEKRQIAVIKAMQKAGLPVKRAVIEGVAVEFGRPEPEPPPPDEIETPEQLRRLI